jgi:Ca-activated chloride channel family protein
MSSFVDNPPDSMQSGFVTFVAEPDPFDNPVVINKVFTLIIDRSGSMYGTKIQQAKDAACFIVNNLNDGDMFNIVSFSSDVSPLWQTHRIANASNREQAINLISGITATGGTNVSSAFDVAVPQFSTAGDDTANIIIFLTDGCQTEGITNTDELVAHIHQLIENTETGIFLFNFGIGSDVDTRCLSLLAADNNGLAMFLGANDLESTISHFYLTIQNPVMLNTQISFSPAVVSGVFPDPLPNLYLGVQTILSGRYSEAVPVTVTLSGDCYGQPVAYEYSVNLCDSMDTGKQFLTKIWAKQKIEHLLVEYYRYEEGSPGANEIAEQIVLISQQFGVICPLTSFSGGNTDGEDTVEGAAPKALVNLQGNYPNPFNPSTSIRFSVNGPIKGHAVLRIYNLRGQVIRTLGAYVNGPGTYEITWNGRDDDNHPVASGMYFYMLDVADHLLSGKMTLLK